MQLGLVGLGRMGGNMAERLRAAGHEVVGYDPHSEASAASSLAEAAPTVRWTRGAAHAWSNPDRRRRAVAR